VRVTAIDGAVLAVARRQHGVFSRDQAFAAGASARFTDRRLAGGDWIRLDDGVYALPAFPPTYLRQCKAAELGTRESAIAGLAAGAVLELTGYRRVRPELVVPPTVHRSSKLATIHRYAGAKVTSVSGIRVTTVAQTLCDTVRRIDLWTFERAMDDALLDRRVTVGELDERRRFYDGSRRPGSRLFAGFVAERMAEGYVPPESELEAVAAKLLARFAGRARFRRQVRLRWRSGAEHRVDFVCTERRLIVEVDGRRWHTRVQDFDRDLWRTNEAVAHGYRVLRFTWVHLTTAPEALVAVIDRVLAPAA
jgi:very-short-patch-repair endonuclease